MKPLISINITCYNRKEMLRECIQSFISQTFKDWELILVDDGSEEDLTFVTGMDTRVKYFRQEHLGESSRGIAAGFNLALDNSTGDYIMPFGSDDLAYENLLEMLLPAILVSDVVYCDHWLRLHDGKKRRMKHGVLDYNRMLEKQQVAHSGTLWRRDKMPRYDETLGGAEDWELFLTSMESGLQFNHIPYRLWEYRVGHPRESGTARQTTGCQKVMAKRGYCWDNNLRKGIKI